MNDYVFSIRAIISYKLLGIGIILKIVRYYLTTRDVLL